MSRRRKFLGFWIILAIYVISPLLFLHLISWIDRYLGLPPLMPGKFNVFLAIIALLSGFFWTTWTYSYLHFVGRGSPAEFFGVALFPTERLVTTGPYAYARNPMLIGMSSLLFAVDLYANSSAGLILVPIVALCAIVYIKVFEEPGLERRFGVEYIRYRESVPALIPRFRPYIPPE